MTEVLSCACRVWKIWSQDETQFTQAIAALVCLTLSSSEPSILRHYAFSRQRIWLGERLTDHSGQSIRQLIWLVQRTLSITRSWSDLSARKGMFRSVVSNYPTGAPICLVGSRALCSNDCRTWGKFQVQRPNPWLCKNRSQDRKQCDSAIPSACQVFHVFQANRSLDHWLVGQPDRTCYCRWKRSRHWLCGFRCVD